MRVSIVSGWMVAVQVAVMGSMVMIQGCTSTRSESGVIMPSYVDTAPVPPMPPSANFAPVTPVTFPPLVQPIETTSKASSTAGNLYIVKSGDSLSKIAAAHGVKTAELKELNKITDVNKIRIGQKLLLPDFSKASTSPAAKDSAVKAGAAVSGDAYIVKSGDSLSKIAVAHGVKTKDLMAANQISDANKIRMGQKLVIPGAKKGAEKAEKVVEKAAEKVEKVAEEVVEKKSKKKADDAAALPPPVPGDDFQSNMLDYSPEAGDTLDSISRLFFVSKESIMEANGMSAGQEVQVGKKIKVPSSDN